MKKNLKLQKILCVQKSRLVMMAAVGALSASPEAWAIVVTCPKEMTVSETSTYKVAISELPGPTWPASGPGMPSSPPSTWLPSTNAASTPDSVVVTKLPVSSASVSTGNTNLLCTYKAAKGQVLPASLQSKIFMYVVNYGKLGFKNCTAFSDFTYQCQ